ncbi:IS66 family transposase [Dyadobacter sp. LHD-138]|uniref:IS66 family transposase n=1 Tax=Dyadobacter sp. LHD-138 TaxID=3071413 RepID=UPI0027E0DD9A|nr:IS66 family transposase [Dyadobacter sp. LHD-138]MDQ6482643.1 IS66 family transposase [Dyadobacter sp. LHD-138]
MEDTATDYKLLYENALAAHKKVVAQKDEQIQALNFELDKYKRYIFGKKNDKLGSVHTDVNQIDLFELGTSQQQQEELSQQAADVVKEKTPAKKREKGTGRMILPENLRREVIIIEPTEDVTGCTVIGEDVTEVLDLIPAEFYVKRYIRYRYARANGEGIITGSLPDRVIEKGIPSEAVIAQMVVDKYVFGLPLHRQIDKYRRLGVNVPASTASDWIMKGWQHLAPLWELLKLLVINQKYLQLDETPLKVLDRDHKNGIHQGYVWIYNAPCDKLTLFDYRKGRDQSGPKQMLEGYAGILQVDGYSVYEKLFRNHPDILLVYCMAHARRKFIDALKYDQERSTYVLERMQVLYAVEKQMREEQLGWEEKTKLRQEKSVPILLELKQWMTQQLPLIIPKSPLGQALAYTLPRWEGLSAYALHGQIEIDNNLAENAIRPIAIGRKSFLFAGSHQAAEMTAAIYSFMATCKKNGIDELLWLKDVFERIQSHKQKDLYQLLPNNWEKFRNLEN